MGLIAFCCSHCDVELSVSGIAKVSSVTTLQCRHALAQRGKAAARGVYHGTWETLDTVLTPETRETRPRRAA